MSPIDDQSEHPEPVVEATTRATPVDPTTRALHLRIRQQEILAELGVIALQGTPFPELLNRTARFTAEGMEAEFCKVLEYIPAENRLLVRAGVGWHENIIGVASVGADLESPSGFALRTGRPVISNHLENEQRFRTPELLVQHGIRRAMNVILQGENSPYGVLEVDSRSEGEFSESDIAFLQGTANILGMAIERQRQERNLKTALERYQILLREINHRVKNSLQIVTGMLHLQASSVNDAKLSEYLTEASNRISAIGRAYERLAYDAEVDSIDLGAYLQAVCADAVSSSRWELVVNAVPGILIHPDRAIPIALIANELVTNATKYAFVGRTTGHIQVALSQSNENAILILVRDNGVGLPPEFNLTKSKGLGMRVVMALAKQLGGDVSQGTVPDGTEFATDSLEATQPQLNRGVLRHLQR
jgi:two-component sensor histidine kinase